jgi:hypothetical protein
MGTDGVFEFFFEDGEDQFKDIIVHGFFVPAKGLKFFVDVSHGENPAISQDIENVLYKLVDLGRLQTLI